MVRCAGGVLCEATVIAFQEMSEPMGAVGELSGVLFFQNLPVYAQMAGGLYSDGQVEGGFWLFEGLPYPHALQQPPPLWLDPTDRVTEARAREQPCEDSEKLHDLDDEKFLEALDEIDLPPPWEKRRDRGGERGGGISLCLVNSLSVICFMSLFLCILHPADKPCSKFIWRSVAGRRNDDSFLLVMWL